MRLQPADDVYRRIRDLNFSEVGRVLHASVRKLDATYEERKTDDCASCGGISLRLEPVHCGSVQAAGICGGSGHAAGAPWSTGHKDGMD